MKPTRLRKVLRRFRWTLFAGLFLLLYIFVLRRYRLMELPYPGVAAMASSMQVGGRHLVDTEPPLQLERDWIVAWSPDGKTVAFSRIVAVPGDRVREKRGRILVEHRDGSKAILAPEVRLSAHAGQGVIEEGNYFLLNDDLSSPFPDSRNYGPVPREQITIRVWFSLSGG